MTRSHAQIISAFADAARLTPFTDPTHTEGKVTWRDALFTSVGPGSWALTRQGEPDRALLTALAEEYVTLDEHAATLPRRLHLEWLRDVLGIERLPVVPDRVVASATVEPKLAPAVVPAGTVLRGGKDAFGNERRYRTVDALTAHGAALEGVRVMVPGGPPSGAHGAVFSAPDFPIAPPTTDDERDAAPPAPHRLRITSPALGFVGGTMKVTLGFNAMPVPGGAARIATLRAAAEWRHPLPDGTLSVPVAGGGSGFGIEVTMSGGCVDPDGGEPWIECVIPAGIPVPEGAAFVAVMVSVAERSDVVPDAAFANDGLVDITKEFEPFAATATKGDAFYVRSDEVLSKAVNSLTVSATLFSSKTGGLSFTWDAVLIEDMGYVTYALMADDYDFDEIQATGTVMDDGIYWGPSSGGTTTTSSAPAVSWQRLLSTGWANFGSGLSGFGGTTGTLGGQGSLPSQVSGQPGRYIRCFIASGDLGWSDYQKRLADFATKAVKAPLTVPDMPSPITPALYKDLRLSYTTDPVAATRVESWSGWRHSVMSGMWQPFRRQVDAVGSTGMVAIGLALPASATGSSVSVYIELDSASPCGATDDVDAEWQWWNGTHWVELVAADGTSRLRESGLLRFVAPDGWAEGCDDVTAAHGKWVRMVTNQPERLGLLRSAIPDAVIAEYVSSAADPANDPSPATALPVGAIKGTLAPISGVKKVTNLASVRGRGPETDDDYARRASALVRHRGRAITAWDYEQMIAIQFPEVAAVKCLPHTDSEGHRAPGRVGLVLIPDEPTRVAPRPSVSLAGRATDALNAVMPAGANVSVLCPCYAPVTITATIRLRAGVAAISGTASVTSALEALLHPTTTVPTRWGVSLYSSALIAALERLWDVDAVLTFAMAGPDGAGDVVAVEPKRGLYCSSGAHNLTFEEQL
ncbi:baseplate J/gp47 family protein [Demequina sp.]|uniref:baseplate J/gp47 family protein n=1 Tax=Demequina sp. TaxID=2050685 RepID=UPI003D0DE106